MYMYVDVYTYYVHKNIELGLKIMCGWALLFSLCFMTRIQHDQPRLLLVVDCSMLYMYIHVYGLLDKKTRAAHGSIHVLTGMTGCIIKYSVRTPCMYNYITTCKLLGSSHTNSINIELV